MTNKKSIPQHQLLTDAFRRNILSGKWPVGNLIPTEMDLCNEFSASRTTVRKALEALTFDGLIERRAGRGTWVMDFQEAPQVWRLKSEAVNYPYPVEMTAEILGTESVDRGVAPDLLHRFESDEPISRIRMLRRTKETPFAFVFTYIPTRYVELVLQAFDPAENNFLFLIMERATGRTVSEVQDSFDATLAVGETAQRLDVLPGSPLFHITRRLLDQDGRLIQATEIYSRPDLHKLVLVHSRERLQKAFGQKEDDAK